MSPTGGVKLEPRQAAVDLARLTEKQLGYGVGTIDPIALGLFIKAYWSRVAMYSHAIAEVEWIITTTKEAN